ncbi:unnamed protein product [Cuscuta epithymum]|uniref:Uncharacterized protein n=1 Tax=Cuscuta epithymum TaxID=186058 RepID=A0AAV0ER42_9ASTE|nr:unnamed protein product [Cuscuta epithymum]CAH9125727.1 unnamed protein product [Cuscuta epithymum]
MFKQSPTSRSHRSKGIKTKHVLQICLLLAVCFWLVYQVKRSYDKGKEFDETDSGFSLKSGSIYETTKWGRKSLLPHSSNGITTTKPKQDNENQDEDEDAKTEEVEPDQDNKFEDENDEDRGGGDDAVDEHDQEKSDEQEDELVDVETDMKSSEENTDHELDEEDSMSTHEALYKADDASSAVTHDTGFEDAIGQNATQLTDDRETNRSLITTGHDESVPEHVLSTSMNTSLLNKTRMVETNSHLELIVTLPNLTESNINSTIEGNNVIAGGEHSLPFTFTQQMNASVQIVEKTLSDSNITSTGNEGFTSTSEISSTASTITPSASGDTTLEDHSDTSIPLEEKEVGIDLETLPQIQTEGSNTEDEAVE